MWDGLEWMNADLQSGLSLTGESFLSPKYVVIKYAHSMCLALSENAPSLLGPPKCSNIEKSAPTKTLAL